MLAVGLATLGLTDVSTARRTAGSDAPDSVSIDAPITAPKMFELETATIKDIQTAMAEGSLTSVELVNLYLRRIQAYNQSSTISPVQPLNALLFLNPDLLEDAAQADRLRKQGIILGPLHGIPFLVKGSFSIKGMPISGGVTAWKDLVTQDEAWSVAKLRQAGAIVMGQANMDSWASSATSSTSQIAGTVRSAYLQGALPGGSSGGSGVSAGAYLTHFTFGGETGGSIRNPGDRNGLVAYKVSGGSISVNKIIPLVPERDVIGPMTRSAVDNAIVRDIVGAKDPDDPWAPILPILEDKRKVPETGFVSAVQGATLRGKKIGIIGTYVGMRHPSVPTTVVTTTGNVTAARSVTVASTVNLVVGMRVDGPGVAATVTAINPDTKVVTVGSNMTIANNVPLSFSYVGTGNTQASLNTTPATLALVEQAKLDMEAAGATVEYVFMPSNVDTTFNFGVGAPQLKLNQAPWSNQVASYIYRGLVESIVKVPGESYSATASKVLSTAALTSNISSARRDMMYRLDAGTGVYSPGEAITFGSPEGVEHYRARAMQKNAFEAWMDWQGLDAVVWPVWPDKTRTGGSIIGRDLVNFMHLPAVTVPMGKLTQVATSTLPEGDEPLTLNVTGRLYDDAKVLSIAYAYEQATKHRYSPPLAPPLAGEVFDFKRQAAKPYSTDSKPPVLTYAPAVTYGRGGSVTFTGSVADAGGIDRLEVSVAGTLIPATVEGNSWKAILPAASTTTAFLGEAASVGVVVLAVDAAGNATSLRGDVTL